MSNKIVGVDVGTMFIVSSTPVGDSDVEIKSMRNTFLPITDDVVSMNEIIDTNINYVIHDDGDEKLIYVIGEDAYRFSNIFGKEVRRPMSNGVVSTDEIDATEVLALMLKKLVGDGEGTGKCVYSIPAETIDTEMSSVLYHEQVFKRIFKAIGYDAHPINEAMAVVYSECGDYNLSGITISFGSGLTNVALSYKGTPVRTFSINRAGDWIDRNAGSALGKIANKITAIKEKDNFDILTLGKSKNKNEKKIREAISYYYQSLIEYVIGHMIDQFKDIDVDFDEDIPIIISGGTSKPKGFLDYFKETFKANESNFPIDVSKIKYANDPLSSVSTGCLLYGTWFFNKDEE